jgi:hypothetical protein
MTREMEHLRNKIERLEAASAAREAQTAREIAILQQVITRVLVPQRTPVLAGYLNLVQVVSSLSEFLQGVSDLHGLALFAGFRWREESKRKLILAFQTKAAQNVGHELLGMQCRPTFSRWKQDLLAFGGYLRNAWDCRSEHRRVLQALRPLVGTWDSHYPRRRRDESDTVHFTIGGWRSAGCGRSDTRAGLWRRACCRAAGGVTHISRWPVGARPRRLCTCCWPHRRNTGNPCRLD